MTAHYNRPSRSGSLCDAHASNRKSAERYDYDWLTKDPGAVSCPKCKALIESHHDRKDET